MRQILNFSFLKQDKIKSQSASPDPPTPKKGAPVGKSANPPNVIKTPEPVVDTPKKVAKTKEISKETKQKSEEKSNTAKKTKEVKILPKQKAATEGSSEVDNISDLSALDKDTYKETMSNAEHVKQLAETVKTEVAKGNMVKKPNIKLLHYEDPRIIQLKLTDVSSSRLFLFLWRLEQIFCFLIVSECQRNVCSSR